MRTYFFFAVLIMGFFIAITAMVRPDVVNKKYQEASRPLEQYQKQRESEALQITREQDHAQWMLKHTLPGDCYTTTKEVRKLQCRYLREEIERGFIRAWNATSHN